MNDLDNCMSSFLSNESVLLDFVNKDKGREIDYKNASFINETIIIHEDCKGDISKSMISNIEDLQFLMSTNCSNSLASSSLSLAKQDNYINTLHERGIEKNRKNMTEKNMKLNKHENEDSNYKILKNILHFKYKTMNSKEKKGLNDKTIEIIELKVNKDKNDGYISDNSNDDSLDVNENVTCNIIQDFQSVYLDSKPENTKQLRKYKTEAIIKTPGANINMSRNTNILKTSRIKTIYLKNYLTNN